ncbi:MULTISPECIES: hypothetical protein [unclassified Moraxella]|uniref:hypothetical protein n=1 Tax=unclassified Moraxella TaxID=2685852 RepID=UPI003AF994E6
MGNVGQQTANKTILMMLWAMTSLMTISPISHAEPQVVVTDPRTGQPLATQPTPASTVIPASSIIPTQNPAQPTLAQMNKPNDSALSQANNELLAKNAELQRQVDSLNTQNNVLVNEHSGQLFIYGAFTALLSGVLGVALGWVVFGRKKSGW